MFTSHLVIDFYYKDKEIYELRISLFFLRDLQNNDFQFYILQLQTIQSTQSYVNNNQYVTLVMPLVNGNFLTIIKEKSWKTEQMGERLICSSREVPSQGGRRGTVPSVCFLFSFPLFLCLSLINFILFYYSVFFFTFLSFPSTFSSLSNFSLFSLFFFRSSLSFHYFILCWLILLFFALPSSLSIFFCSFWSHYFLIYFFFFTFPPYFIFLRIFISLPSDFNLMCWNNYKY